MISRADVNESLDRLTSYCRDRNWAGHDPFDGLNSRVFRAIPGLRNSRIGRLVFLQLLKRSPINFRPLLGIPRGRNPKGIGLFLSSVAALHAGNPRANNLELMRMFMDWLRQDATAGVGGLGWGYNFDWQSRAFFLPMGTPTVVNTSFVGRAFLDAYRVTGDPGCLETARGACGFILKDLNRMEAADSLCFSYSPLDRYFVHNATALAASLLALTSRETGESGLAETAARSLRYVAENQQEDGSWRYGEDEIALRTGTDCFHTGFILESLGDYARATGDDRFNANLTRGLDFFQEQFFLEDGVPKYFPDRAYPADIHSAAQAVVTLVRLRGFGADPNLSSRVLSWMINRMQHRSGFFYYRRTKWTVNRIPYMRWGQAWAMRALTCFLEGLNA